LTEFLAMMQEAVDTSLAHVLSPSYRTYWGYLGTSLLIAAALCVGRPERANDLRKTLSPETLWGASSRTDMGLFLVNALAKVALLGQFVGFGLDSAESITERLEFYIGAPPAYIGLVSAGLCFTLVASIFGDGTYYILHRLMHRVPLLWLFHSVHHSATHLTPLTQLRLHPLEMLINNVRSVLVFAFAAGVTSYLAGPALNATTLLGANAVLTAFYATGANLRHSHIRFSYGPRLERWLISPAQHQLHHSAAVEDHHRNFGSKFAIWDRLGGTLKFGSSTQKLHFGIGRRQPKVQGPIRELLRPFQTKPKTLPDTTQPR